jgi:hypothetical protein
MNPKLAALFDEPENAYLSPDELQALSQFVGSLPERIDFYRCLRHEEATLLQTVVDRLQQSFPQASEEQLKRCLQNGILSIRYAAMAMLTDDPDFVTKRLVSWLPDMIEAYDTRPLDQTLHQLIREQFAGRFSAAQMGLLTPGLDAAQRLLFTPDDDTTINSETLVGLF